MPVKPSEKGIDFIMSEKDNDKEIEIVNGDGSNLEISDVYDHLKTDRPNHSEKKPEHVVVPEEHKKK